MADGDDSHDCPTARAVAQALRGEYEDDFDWSFVSVDGLSVREAWAMATAWTARLGGHVLVCEEDRETRREIVPNYESNYVWIELRLGCCAIDHEVRASSLVWRALAACQGFSLDENPEFWKRVMDSLMRRPLGLPEPPTCRANNRYSTIPIFFRENRFFEGKSFPRFKLKVHRQLLMDDVERVLRSHCGPSISVNTADNEQVSSVQSQLESTLARLAPLVRRDRLTDSPVELTLHGTIPISDEQRLNDIITAIEATQPSGVLASLHSPTFVVKSVQLGRNNAWWMTNEDSYRHGLVFGRGICKPLEVVEIEFDMAKADRLAFMDVVQWVLAENGAHHLKLYVDTEYEARHLEKTNSLGIAALCSALPRASMIKTVTVQPSHHLHPSHCNLTILRASAVAWLGYALFHPDTASSTWCNLVLTNFKFSPLSCVHERDAVLPMMAQGNNLRVALGTSTTRVDAYYTATLRQGAVIYESPSFDANVVQVLDQSSTMDVCVTSTDVDTLDEWVFVVVAGYGHAWVQRRYVESIVSRPAGRPSLRRLSLFWCESLLEDLLAVAGDAMEQLDLEYKCYSSVQMQLSSYCPRLTGVDITLERESLRDLQFPSHLRHLHLERCFTELSVSDTLLASLQSLETLSIATVATPSNDSMKEFVLPVLRGLPRLRRFLWVDQTYRRRKLEKLGVTYEMESWISRQLLPGVVWGQDDFTVIQGTPPRETLETLLLLVKRLAYPELSQDVVAHIGGFVGTRVNRHLWVRGSSPTLDQSDY